MQDAGAQFGGFGPDALGFLARLAASDDRAWFKARQDAYERSVKSLMLALAADLGTALAKRDIPLYGDPKRALFRIQRDTRFARGKSPYRTNVGAVLTRTGEKHDRGVLYLHLSQNGSVVAADFYMLALQELKVFHERILLPAEDWRTISVGLAEAGLSLSREWATARLPRGFDAAEVGDLADDLKLKSFTVSQPFNPDEAASPTMADHAAGLAFEGKELLPFDWHALDGLPAKDRNRPRAK